LATWDDKLRAELDRSLRRYPATKTAAAVSGYLGRLLWRPRSVLIYDSRIFVSSEFLAKEKNKKHVNFVASVMTAGALPNAAYLFEGNSTGYCSDDDAGLAPEKRLPCLVIAKRGGYKDPGVLVPNPYFHDLQFWNAVRTAVKSRAAKRPFAQRHPSVFWRGHLSAGLDWCPDEVGNFARLEAVSLSMDRGDVVDVRCWMLKKCVARDPQKACAKQPYDDRMRAVQADLRLVTVEAHVAKENFTAWQYVLNLPGSSTGSYSRNLNHLWFLGSVVVFWKASFVEWYFPALQDGETHVVADKQTLVSTIERLNKDPAQQKRLVANAGRVDEELVCPQCLARYLRMVVDALRQRFSLSTVLDDPCRARDLFQSLDCTGLELHEVFPTVRQNSAFDIEGRRLTTVATSKKLQGGCDVLIRHATRACDRRTVAQ